MPNTVNTISPVNHTEPLTSFTETSASPGKTVTVQAHHITKPTHSFINKIKVVLEKVKKVATFILKASLSVFLYWINPSIFAIGFVAGIIFDEQVRSGIQKIKDVWKTQKLAGTILGGLACTLSLPITIATASLLWSAHLGSLMSTEAQKKLKDHPFVDGMIQKHSVA